MYFYAKMVINRLINVNLTQYIPTEMYCDQQYTDTDYTVYKITNTQNLRTNCSCSKPSCRLHGTNGVSRLSGLVGYTAEKLKGKKIKRKGQN